MSTAVLESPGTAPRWRWTRHCRCRRSWRQTSASPPSQPYCWTWTFPGQTPWSRSRHCHHYQEHLRAHAISTFRFRTWDWLMSLPMILRASGFCLICGRSSNSFRHKVPDLSVSSFLNLFDSLEISSWDRLDSGKEDVTPMINNYLWSESKGLD